MDLSHHLLTFKLENECAPIDTLAQFLLVASNLDPIDLRILTVLICVLQLGQTEKLSVDLSLASPLHLLVVGLGTVGMGSTHMTA